MAITCKECIVAVSELLQIEAEGLFDSSVSSPEEAHGINNHCSLCGRNWVLVLTTLAYEGDLIPAHAVLDDEPDYPALTELEAREAMEGL